MHRQFVMILAGLFTCSAASAERVSDPTLGLTIETPGDWCELPTTDVNKDPGAIEKDNPELAEAIRKHGFVPVHLFGRNPTGPFSATINLSTQPVGPLKGQSDQQALLAFLASSVQQMPLAKMAAAPDMVTLGGKPAAHVTLTWILNVQGSSIPITSEVWAMRRGAYYLILGAAYHSDEKSGDRAEVMEIVNSLNFTDRSGVPGR